MAAGAQESSEKRSWKTIAPLPTARGFPGGAYANGNFFVIGGYNQCAGGYFGMTKNEMYVPSKNVWVEKAPMPTPRYALGVTAGPQGDVYAVGGENSITRNNVTQQYDPDTDTWQTRAPMPAPRSQHGLASGIDGMVYAIGGAELTNNASSRNEAYHPETNTWSARAPMPTPRRQLALARDHKGRIYAVGGFTNGGQALNVLEIYHPQNDTWTVGAPMPTARAGAGIGVGTDGRIYVFGGRTGNEATASFTSVNEAYDPGTNTWTEATPLPYAKRGMASTAFTGPNS